MVLLKDIAKATGFDVSTVSRALKERPDISLKTRSLVKSVADEMDYKPKHRKERIVGVLLPEVVSSYFAKIAHALNAQLDRNDYTMQLMIVGFSGDRIERAIRLLEHQNASGILLSSAAYDSAHIDAVAELMRRTDIPIGILAETSDDVPVNLSLDSVYIDQRKIMSLIIEYLMGLNHRKIGYIGELFADTRYDAMCSILTEKKVAIDQRFIKRGEERFEMGGYLRALEILREDTLPTAIIASYDQMALGAIKAFRENGIHVPQHMSIVGIDNMTVDDYVHPSLTSVQNPVTLMCSTAVKLLKDAIKNPQNHVNQRVAVQSKLIVRKSAATLRTY